MAEIGSFHLAQETEREVEEAPRLNSARLHPAVARNVESKASRKKSAQNVAHGYGKPPLRSTSSTREGYITSRLFTKPLAARDAMTMERRIHLINKYRQNFEMKLSAAVRRSEQAEAQLAVVVRGRGETEKSLASALKSRQHTEGKLAAALKLHMDLKERVVLAERAQEDSNNLCNVVHSENLRLEHDLAFLKAVLEDTQKELQSTREVLATERTSSFQLKIEVSELKKKLPHSATEELPTPAPATPLSPVSENACLVAPD